jgi:hypothetical protein
MLPQIQSTLSLFKMTKEETCLIVNGHMNMIESVLNPPIAQALLPEWHQFSLHSQLYRALHLQGFITPTPIQSKAIPSALKGKDVVGVAQTVRDNNHLLWSDMHSPNAENRAQVKRLRMVYLYLTVCLRTRLPTNGLIKVDDLFVRLSLPQLVNWLYKYHLT